MYAAVLLAEMHSIGTQPLGEGHAVIDDEGDPRVRADALQGLCKTRELMLRNIFHSELEGGDYLILRSGLQPIREGAAHVLGRDEVQPAGFSPLRSRELGRLELVFQG